MPYHNLHIIDISMPAPHPSSTLLEAFEHQDEVIRPSLRHSAGSNKPASFPRRLRSRNPSRKSSSPKSLGQLHLRETAGAPSFSRPLREGGDFDVAIAPATLFDLASLTKVVATTTTAMLLYERGLLDLEAPVSAIVPEFTADPAKDPRRREITLRMLLAHSSGLPAHEKFFLKARTRDELLQAAFTTPLAADPATRAEYSDIGFIILGVALERLADESLDRFCQREIFAPLA